ncbi:unnamed protein product [Linum trigynum]|uniref:RNase H type-1 domain-containing protein n=1 Tax=Linum trigynum TaxID=586398 RepID=A0AAV2FGA8_9ROSI
MAPWKAKRLSFAGRLTLAKSVAASLPVYNMQTELLPSSVCKSIDKLSRDFIWGDDENKAKMHLVSWDVMTRPKPLGGVGIRPTRQANLALLAKNGWRLLKDKECLWTQIMRAKYGRQRQGLEVIRPSQGSSFTWASIAKTASLIKQGCAWNIKNGKRTNFWLDIWVSQVPLRDLAIDGIPMDLEGKKVAEMVRDDGTWKTELFEHLLPSEITQKILSTMVDTLSQEDDDIFWAAAADGKFSTKSAYNLLTQHSQHLSAHDEKTWKTIWRLPTPERVRSFMWLASSNKLATNVMRHFRRVADFPCCMRCPGVPETVLHILRDCPPALFFWARHVPSEMQQRFFSSNQQDWFRDNLMCSTSTTSGMEWPAFFSTASWLLWKNRTTAAFKGIGAALTTHSLEHSIIARAKLWHDSWVSPSPLQNTRSQAVERTLANIGWTPPVEGWTTLNVDGASNGNPGPAGAGGLLRDHTGRWIKGFVSNVGSASATLAELWAINHGIDLAWKEGFRTLKIESDSKMAIQLIENRHDPVHPYATILSTIRRKISNDWLVRIVHTYREGNRAADWLSKHSLVFPYGTHELVDPPVGLVSILRDDMMGTTQERRIVVPSSSSL